MPVFFGNVNGLAGMPHILMYFCGHSPPPIDLKPIQPSELHAWTAPSMVITKTPLISTENRMAISQVSQSVQTPQLIPGSDVHAATSKTNITVSYQPKGQSPLTSINYYPMNEIPPLVVISNEKSPEDKAHSSDLEKNSVSDTNHRFTMDSQIHPIRRTSETEQISATAIAAMNPSVQPTTETHPLKTEGENPVNVSASGFSHLFWKTVGIVVDNTFALGEIFNPTISIPPKKSAQEAWNQDVVPLVHEKIDQTFGTEIKEEFNRNNDSWAKRAMDTIIYNPISYLTNLGTTAYKAINGVSKEGVVPSTVLQEATATGTVGKLAGETTAGRLEGQIIAREVSREGQVVLNGASIGESKVGGATQNLIKHEQITNSASGVPITEGEISGSASNRAVFEEYKTVLRQQMEKPFIIDLELQKILAKIINQQQLLAVVVLLRQLELKG